MHVNCKCWLWLFQGCLISNEMYPATAGLLKVMVCKQHTPTLHQSPVQWARQWSHSEGADELLNSPVERSAKIMTAINQAAKQSTRTACTRQECMIESMPRPKKFFSWVLTEGLECWRNFISELLFCHSVRRGWFRIRIRIRMSFICQVCDTDKDFFFPLPPFPSCSDSVSACWI